MNISITFTAETRAAKLGCDAAIAATDWHAVAGEAAVAEEVAAAAAACP